MNIIFISATCFRSDYDYICKRRKYPLLDSSQKFFDMFLNGYAGREDVSVDCITVPPISQGTYPDKYVKGNVTQNGNITYHYTAVWNFSVIKSVFAKRSIARILKKLIKKYKGNDIKIICDPLLMEGLLPTIKAGKRYKLTTVGFLTDMPSFADECDEMGSVKRMLYRVYNDKIEKNMGKLDKHIVLTEDMSCVAEGGKPWLLVDCIVDEDMLRDIAPMKREDKLPHVIYAGKLHREFGLALLAQAIPQVKSPCVFDIYGDGNYIDELKALAEKKDNVKIHGIVPLNDVLSAELSAALLINPRTSEGEFTKYSFPSKTAEYMLSGVPVVMFKLPGMSSVYGDYICFAEEETAESLAARIDAVLSLTDVERSEIGAKAKEFVIQNKNNRHQAQRVLEFIED